MSTRGWSVTLPVTVSPSPLYTHCQMAQWTLFRTKQTSSAREAYLLLLEAHWPCKACLLLCLSKGRQTKLWKPSPNIIFKTPTSSIPILVKGEESAAAWWVLETSSGVCHSGWVSPSQMWRHLGLQLKVTLRWFYFKLCLFQTGNADHSDHLFSMGNTLWKDPWVSLEFLGICSHCNIWNSSLR